MIVPDYVRERILRKPPEGVSVVPYSTPVTSFGDPRIASVVTLGWNPSRREFADRNGVLLSGVQQRLETWATACEKSSRESERDPVFHVFKGCNDYFCHRPYSWFNRLAEVLKYVGVSYRNSTACHLDFVQWATDPIWRKLPRNVRSRLLLTDVPFLREQLATKSIKLLLLNGHGIIKAAKKHLGVTFESVKQTKDGRVKLFRGLYDERLQVIGWNLNLQSSFGVSLEEINQIGKELRAAFKTS